jgi:hypothetical protein
LISLEGILQYTLKHRLPSTLDEAHDFAYQIEENVKFEDSIHQINLLQNDDPWESSDESCIETELNLHEILEVKPIAPRRKWSTCSTNIQDVSYFSQEEELPKKIEPLQNVFLPHKGEEVEASLPQIYRDEFLEEVSPFFH